MRIGIFTDSYYPQINGVITSIRTLEKELEARGHKVFIITTTDPQAEKPAKHVFRLPSMPFIFLPTFRVAVLYSNKMAKGIEKLNLDLIHTHSEFSVGLFGRMMAKRLNLPVIHTYHTMYEDYLHYVKIGKLPAPPQAAAKRLSKLYCQHTQTVIAPSPKTLASLRSYGITAPIEVIPTGTDLKPFSPNRFTSVQINEQKNLLGINDSDQIIVYVGRVAKEKSIDIVIKAMPEVVKNHPQAKFLVVGDGPVLKELVALVETLHMKDHVIFAGRQPWDSIGLFYQLGNLFVTASVTETQGLTLTEAMASGTVVIAKSDKNLDGIVQDKLNGRIFTQDSELAPLLNELLSDHNQCVHLIQNGFETAEKYSSERFGEQVESLYRKVISNHTTKKKSLLPVFNKKSR